MTQPRPMGDVIVLVPGILGSVLVKDGREVWGASGRSVIDNLITFGGAVRSLKLESGVGHDDPKDGVSAPRLLPRLHMIPTFWKADGYGRLIDRLLRSFTLTPAVDDQAGNLIEFPYDWRLSNQLNGQRLRDKVMPHLDRWRHHTKNRDAKLIFICHSMGGIVARWFLEVRGGREETRTLITVATPYRGSVNALDALVNGVFLGVGPIGIAIDELVRSFPSVYQLLPSYECLDVGDGRLTKLSGVDLPNVNAVNVREGLAIHERIGSAIEAKPRYETFSIKGINQPTYQSALLRGTKVEPLQSHRGTDHEGDGTVPRPSSHPPEWPTEKGSFLVSQSHAMLQSTEATLTHLYGMLTSELGNFMGGMLIGADIPNVVRPGSPVPIEATSPPPDVVRDLPLHVVCRGEDGQRHGEPVLMRPLGDGRYRAQIDGLPEGAWQITVQSATTQRQVEPVSDWTLAWSENR